MSFVADFITGRTIDFTEIESCLRKLEDRWLGSFHMLQSGEAGWYRRLTVMDRVGIVATANAITALRASGHDVPQLHNVVRTLVTRRRPEGGWSFVSNITDTSVVDATAATLMALYEWHDEVEFRNLNLQGVIQDSLDWLELVALREGGWGLIAEGPYRNYSTALAIQALCACGRRSSSVVQRGIHRLISESDTVSGGWQDACRVLSVPTTSEAIRALEAAATNRATYAAELSRACDWLLQIARDTRFWEVGPVTASLEEVDVVDGTRRVRIEYGHSPRPVAITALALAGTADVPEVVAAMRMLLDDCGTNRWDSTSGGKYTEPPSWMLYDVMISLLAFRNGFSRNAVGVWADNVRIVEHIRGQGPLTCKFIRHWPKLLLMSASGVLLWMLLWVGMVRDLGAAALLAILAACLLDVISTPLLKFFRNLQRKRRLSVANREHPP